MTTLLLLMALARGPAPGAVEHAKIVLDVATPQGKETAFVDQTPPSQGKNPRPVARARTGEPVKVNWTFTNVYPHKTLPNVLIHFYVTPAEKVGQKELPQIDDDVVVETAFELDLKPGGKSGGRQTLRIDKPGVYLVRVESRQTGSDHEHFAAIDLVVEKD
jgi:hypothetical protein